MNIFDQIPVDADSFEPAVGALLRRAAQMELLTEQGFRRTRWSLVELRADDDDYAWICGWARRLTPRQARNGLLAYWSQFEAEGLRFTAREGFGWLLLILATETARRQGGEGNSLWAAMRREPDGKLRLQELADRELFAEGQPTRLHRESLEAAARRLHLRSLFNLDGVRNPYGSILLQCGLTRRSIRRRLPHWLAGQEPPEAIRRLLLGPLSSEEFMDLWNHLLHFRLGNIPEEQLRAAVADNPWALPEWADDFVRCAKLELTDPSVIAFAAASNQPAEQSPFLDEPVLSWKPPGAPRFVSRLRDVAQLDLSEDQYSLVIGGQRCGTLRRQPTGDHAVQLSASAGPGEVAVPVAAPNLAASLVAEDGEVAANRILTLWSPGADIVLFHMPSGVRLGDPPQEPLDPSLSYALMVAEDLTVEPAPAQSAAIAGFKLYLLPPGTTKALRVLADGMPLWCAHQSCEQVAAEPEWSAEVSITRRGSGGQMGPGDPLQVIVAHPPEIAVQFIRAGGKPIEWKRTSDTRTVSSRSVIIDPAVAGTMLAVTLGLIRGEEKTVVQRQLELPLTGAARLVASVWTPLHGEDFLTVEQARMSPVRLWMPARADRSTVVFSEWAMMEGDSWVGRLSRHARPIGGLAGVGAPLTVRRGPYNSTGDVMRLAREVRDNGLLANASAQPPDSPRTLRLELTGEHPLAGDERIICWDASGKRFDLTPHLVAEHPSRRDWWEADLPANASVPMAVAVALRGQRAGLWYDARWPEMLSTMSAPPRDIAALLRWLRLPLLSDSALPKVREFALRAPGEVLAAWIAAQAPEGLTWRLEEEGWVSVVRAVFRDWQPDLASINPLLDVVEAQSEILPLVNALALELMNIHPALMGRVVRCYVEQTHLPKYGKTAAKSFLGEMMLLIGRLPEGSTRQALRDYRAKLVLDAAATMQISDSSVRALLRIADAAFQGTTPEPVQQDNLDVAINTVEPFRRLFALSVLDAVLQKM